VYAAGAMTAASAWRSWYATISNQNG
jgi:hypothetical protein